MNWKLDITDLTVKQLSFKVVRTRLAEAMLKHNNVYPAAIVLTADQSKYFSHGLTGIKWTNFASIPLEVVGE